MTLALCVRRLLVCNVAFSKHLIFLIFIQRKKNKINYGLIFHLLIIRRKIIQRIKNEIYWEKRCHWGCDVDITHVDVFAL